VAGNRVRRQESHRYRQPATFPTGTAYLPGVLAVLLDRTDVPRYESLERTVPLDAQYANPFDAHQVDLDGIFKSPDGKEMKVPGFEDGQSFWKMRFTPSRTGSWSYQLVVKDSRGSSLLYAGNSTVSPSDLHGWLQPGNWVNPEFSGHHLVYQDGTPLYGVGRCDALNIRGLAGGTYTVRPYDACQGKYLDAFKGNCSEGTPCTVALPDFKAEMAFRLEQKQT
jgi:hypothetical protein